MKNPSKFKKWLIKKLGGYTQREYESAMKRNFVEELEYRVSNGKNIVIGVRALSLFRNIKEMFSDKCVANNRNLTIKYNDLTFKVMNVTNKRELERLKGLNLNGFFFID